MGNPCVSHSITEPQIDDNYELLCRLWSPVVGAEEGGLSTVVARGFQRVNIERLLKNNSVNKSKINFLNDLSDESTLFVALCETFLNDNIFDAEIQMQGFKVQCMSNR